MDIRIFCCLFVVCIYICSAGYVELPVVLLYLLRCLVYHMLSKTRRNSINRSLHRVIAYIYIYMFGWLCRATYCSVVSTSMFGVSMLFKTRRNSGSLHRVIDEVLVLGLLVVVYKIPYSSCIFNTTVVLEPGTMVCAYHTAVYLVHRSCLLCHTY